MELEDKNKLADCTRKRGISPEKSCRPLRNVTTTAGHKFPLLHDGEIIVCRLNHQRTLLNKILGSKMLRRWETHRIVLSDSQIYSSTVSERSIFFFQKVMPVKIVKVEGQILVSRHKRIVILSAHYRYIFDNTGLAPSLALDQ